MNNLELYYKESGKVGPLSIPLMLLAGILVSAVLGAVYSYAIFYIPFIYLNFFLTVFFGMAVGFTIGKIGIFTKARNRMANMGIGLVAGLAAEYFQWVFWIHAASEQTLLSFDPIILIEVIQEVAANGAWSIFGWTPTGAALYVIWGIEALIIIGGSTLFALSFAGRKPFCEDCNAWTEEKTLTARLEPIQNPAKLIAALERNDLEPLTRLRNVPAAAPQRTQVQLLSCPDDCETADTHFLTMDAITVEVNDKGETDEDETPIFENLKISKEAYNTIMEWSLKLDEKVEENKEEGESLF